MYNPRVSVILPCYNLEKRFELYEQALRSVFQQTYQNFEIVVINDGSADNTEELIYAHQAKHSNSSQPIRYRKLERNSGTSIARNEGIRDAQGEIVSFLDFDDLYLPTYLESAVKQFENNESSVVLISRLFYKTIFGKVKVVASQLPDNVNTRPFEEVCASYLTSNFPIAMGSGVVCRKEIFFANPLTLYDKFLSKRTAEDVMFGYRLLLEGFRPYVVEEPLVIHRTFYGEISRSTSAFFNADELEVYNYIYEHTMGPVYERIKLKVPDMISTVDASVARSRREFTIKSHFLKGEWLKLFSMVRSNPKTIKTIIRLVLLKLSGIAPLSAVRDWYFFVCSESNEEAKVRAMDCINSVKRSS